MTETFQFQTSIRQSVKMISIVIMRHSMIWEGKIAIDSGSSSLQLNSLIYVVHTRMYCVGIGICVKVGKTNKSTLCAI